VCLAAAASVPATAQEAAPVTQSAASARTIVARTYVEIEIDDPISSKTAKPGDRFKLHLAEAVTEGGVILLPRGVKGEGEVVHAAKGGLMGKAGELILAARFLDYEGQRIPLGNLKWGRRGQDNTNMAMAAGMAVGIVGVLVTGGNIDVPIGAQATARITTAMTLGDAPPLAVQTQATETTTP